MAIRLDAPVPATVERESPRESPRKASRTRDEHPYVVRMCHWIGALAVMLLMLSGLEIFAAFPSFGEKVPQVDLFVPPAAVRLGGWLGGALQWHLTFAWVL